MTTVPPLEVAAMHGWAGDARCWERWIKATRDHGWRWMTGERGYGELPPRHPNWGNETSDTTHRVVVAHSLGIHLLTEEALRRANAVVLLASFAAFVPPGREGRRTRAALAGMSASLGDESSARGMLGKFMENAAAPQSVELLPPGPLDGPLGEIHRQRLREDLELLAHCRGLPDGLPRTAPVLIVEAEEDRIVEPAARAQLRELLPEADVVRLPGAGHALLAGDVIGRVVEWVETWRGQSTAR